MGDERPAGEQRRRANAAPRMLRFMPTPWVAGSRRGERPIAGVAYSASGLCHPPGLSVAEPKPAHLGSAYAAQFEDETIASAYHTRPPYPPALFEMLARLQPARGRILDLGCGTGDIALGLISHAERVDALDPSAAMLRVARSRPSASDPRLRWIESFR